MITLEELKTDKQLVSEYLTSKGCNFIDNIGKQIYLYIDEDIEHYWGKNIFLHNDGICVTNLFIARIQSVAIHPENGDIEFEITLDSFFVIKVNGIEFKTNKFSVNLDRQRDWDDDEEILLDSRGLTIYSMSIKPENDETVLNIDLLGIEVNA